MPVYVDNLISYHPSAIKCPQARRTSRTWCHMWTTPGNEPELHQLAAAIGLKPTWFQPKPNFPHYDLTPSKRTKAIQAGAIPTSLKHFLISRLHTQASPSKPAHYHESSRPAHPPKLDT